MLVTAGPTYEDFDPVRYIGNRSSGRMGFAIAAEATRRGAQVVLVAGPSSVEPPAVRELVRVRTADDMHAAVIERADVVDVVVMAAAVADYAPVDPATHKVPKSGETVTVVLRKTPDILAELGSRRLAAGRGPVLVGFAAETDDVVARAGAKRLAKRVDLIVANDVSRLDAGFGVDTNEVTIIGADGAEALPLQSKARVAAAILDRIEQLVGLKPDAGSRTTASQTS
jgi:phosphopantothenoylcysteine decarboxylase/phosphopantothenate--cysteine ligase